MEKFNKLSLPAVILIASIILGGFYYASQVIKQQIEIKQSKHEQAGLDTCLSEAHTAYLDLNEKECKEMGLEKGCNIGYPKSLSFVKYLVELESACRNLYPLAIRANLSECLSQGQDNIQEDTEEEWKELLEKQLRAFCFKLNIFTGIYPQ